MQRLAALGDSDLSDSAVAGFIPSAQIQQMLDDYEAGLHDADGPIAGAQAKRLAERQHNTKIASLEEEVARLQVC